jgi:hypothetical protein
MRLPCRPTARGQPPFDSGAILSYSKDMLRRVKPLGVCLIILSQTGFCCCAGLPGASASQTPTAPGGCRCKDQPASEPIGDPASPCRDPSDGCLCHQPKTLAVRAESDLPGKSALPLIGIFTPFELPVVFRGGLVRLPIQHGEIPPLCSGERQSRLSVWLK